MKILNLTQHNATIDQIENGVIEPQNKDFVRSKLNFEYKPDINDIKQRSKELVKICQDEGCKKIMLGGAQYLLPQLLNDLKESGFITLFSFSKRVVKENYKEDGSVVKEFIFKHEGFIEI